MKARLGMEGKDGGVSIPQAVGTIAINKNFQEYYFVYLCLFQYRKR